VKDLSKTIRNGGVQKFNKSQLGLKTQGKGSFPRIDCTNKQYVENFNKIFKNKV